MNSTPVSIIGAGLAGLLAGNLLRRHQPIIFERSHTLPGNHKALLRFRSDQISQITGIPFRKVTVSKAIGFKGKLYLEPTIKYQNLYSAKVTDGFHPRSISSLEPVERWIAPDDFAAQLANSCHIKYGSDFRFMSLDPDAITISTIPMPLMMEMMDWQGIPNFNSRPIHVSTAIIESSIPCDLYQTVYLPDPEEVFYRISITGNRVIAESRVPEGFTTYSGKDELHTALATYFGIDILLSDLIKYEHIEQPYGKITPVADAVRKAFIMDMSDNHQLYSLGRFATWRQILLDDLVKDIRAIETMFTTRSAYDRRLR